MDKYTWGDSQGAVNLIATLEQQEYSKYSRKIASHLSRFYSSTMAIVAMPDKAVCEAVLLLWLKHFKELVRQWDMPEVLKTHTLCVATTRIRKFIHPKQPEKEEANNG
jgi:hypothetical protein